MTAREVPIDDLSPHPDAGMVPEMPADEYAAFLADVKARGVKVPLELVPGTRTVIDGRTRLKAARDAGIGAVAVTDADLGADGPVVYMLRAAVSRRHLTAGQRAALAVDIESELAKAAKQRQREGAKKGGVKSGQSRDPVGKVQEFVPEPSPVATQPQARDHAAAVVSVNPRYVSDAKAVKAADPELFERVKAGELTLPRAVQEVRRAEKREELKERAAAAEDATAEADAPPAWEIIQGEVGVAPFPEADPLAAHVLPGSVRLVFADPPYNIGFDYGEGHDDRQPDRDYLDWVECWMSRCVKLLTSDGSMWVLINDEYAAEYAVALKAAGLAVRNWLIWYETFGVNCSDKFNRTKRHLFYGVRDPKRFVFHREAVSRPSDRQTKYDDPRANPDGKVLDDVWLDIPRLVGTAAERVPDFPTQLPLALLRRVVGCCTDPGDLVVDPFSGSGTTGVAAVQLGRRYLGFERSAQFAGLSRLRLKGTSRDTG